MDMVSCLIPMGKFTKGTSSKINQMGRESYMMFLEILLSKANGSMAESF